MSALPSRSNARSAVRFDRLRRWGLLVTAVAVVALAGWLLRPVFAPKAPQIRTAVLVEEIVSVAKLATVELEATVVANKQDSQWYGNRFLFMLIPGRAGVGFDLDGLPEDSVTVSGDSVAIQLPAPKVLYAEIDLENVETYTEKGLLRPQFTPDETKQLLATGQEKIREKASQAAVLAKAKERASALVTQMAKAAGAKSVSVSFRD